MKCFVKGAAALLTGTKGMTRVGTKTREWGWRPIRLYRFEWRERHNLVGTLNYRLQERFGKADVCPWDYVRSRYQWNNERWFEINQMGDTAKHNSLLWEKIEKQLHLLLVRKILCQTQSQHSLNPLTKQQLLKLILHVRQRWSRQLQTSNHAPSIVSSGNLVHKWIDTELITIISAIYKASRHCIFHSCGAALV